MERAELGRWSFFQHRACEFFPCHATDRPEDFNCLFCYCPLYTLGPACGGSHTWLPDGTKDCSACLLPHGRESARHIAARSRELTELANRRRRS